ncbi:glycosyltransferase family 4 protein [Deinococcus sp.]|uniref:glycosyltransferase family 4 protein n=1 Tax=Deinococcus sp. TaxID=47478 RepID=UPI0025BD746E|nr:glycosyltransferase family 4 protein [Deinococcus sp.]
MRILHLAYEDPRQPGAGGGSVRTLEINRRLAQRHQVTAVVAGYPGARPRLEAGVRWLPVGTQVGNKLDQLSYFAALAPVILSTPHDLLIEDFGAPFSVGLAPLYTRRPLIASVQWLFASEMREKYKFPFDLVERRGLTLYDNFIAVSDWLGREISARRPGSAVQVIPNGIPPEAFEVPAQPPEHFLFVGRLDLRHKGGDLLIESFARVREQLGPATPPLLIVGDGADRGAMEQLARQRGLEEHVQFRGRVEGAAKFDLMARAHAVLMPSRFETFGMVAVEAQAAGVPLVTFDVGPLREVAGPGGALLIAPFDPQAFAQAAAGVVCNPARREWLAAQGRLWARHYDWDLLAQQQEAAYVAALARPRRTRRIGAYR